MWLIKLLLIFIVFSACTRRIDEKELLTFYEKSNYLKTPKYDETVAYCKQLAEVSPWIKYTEFGESPQGLKLPLIIVDKNKNFKLEEIRHSDNIVVLIQACVHAGECEGKDAGMMLIRDIAALKKMPELLDHVTILFIPIFNVDGHERFGPYNRINQNGPEEMGWRTTSRNFNLNRDYLKADASEMKSWLKLYNKWLPEFFIDCHTTDGADYQYALTYGLETNGNTEINLSNWMKYIFIKDVEKRMLEKKIDIFPYVGFRKWHDPRSGLRSWVAPPMLGGGYAAVQNRASLLVETHMLKDYKTRVNATYEILKQSLIVLNREYKTLQNLEKSADIIATNASKNQIEIPLLFKQTNDSLMVSFKGFEYTSDSSSLSGGLWFKYSNIPVNMQVPFFYNQQIIEKTKLPKAYIISPEWTEVIKRLELHGIKYTRTVKAEKYKISSYKFKNITFNNRPYEGRFRLQQFDMDEYTEERNYPKGSVVVPTNQRSALVIAHIFEPRAYDSFINWGFFHTIFEQKEYGESYIMEGMAREMLSKDPNLKAEFEKKKSEDKDFAANPEAILNWFYNKSLYQDAKLNIYPVGKIY